MSGSATAYITILALEVLFEPARSSSTTGWLRDGTLTYWTAGTRTISLEMWVAALYLYYAMLILSVFVGFLLKCIEYLSVLETTIFKFRSCEIL